jgi:hypothetical protein
MNYKITNLFYDMAGKYKVSVILSEETNEVQIFKFDYYPTQDEVNAVVENYLSSLNNGEII